MAPAQSSGAASIAVEFVREWVDEVGTGADPLGKAPVSIPAGELCLLAQILATVSAEPADPTGRPQPCDADSRADLDRVDTPSEFDDGTDDLVSGHDRQRPRREITLAQLEVGPADAAGQHLDQDLTPLWLGLAEFDHVQRALSRGSR